MSILVFKSADFKRKIYILVAGLVYIVELKSTRSKMGESKKQTKEKDASSELEELKKQIEEKNAKIAEYLDDLQRLQAEFENYSKRVHKEHQAMVTQASERIVLKLLNIVDDFGRAIKELDVSEKTREGIEMIFKNLHKILEEEKVEEIKCDGCKADPFKHEVVMSVESDQPEDLILEEFQKGYTMNGKVIRYAKVKIAKPKADRKNGGGQ